MPPPSRPMSLNDVLRQAVALHQGGDLAGAERLYREVRRVSDLHPDATHNLAIILAQTGRAEEGAKLLRRLLPRFPTFWAAMGTLALCLKTLGDAAEAVRLLETVLAQRPDHEPTVRNLINAQIAADRPADAVQTARAFVARNPQGLERHALLVDVATTRNRPEDALPSARMLAADRPGAAESWRALAAVERRLHRNARAVALLERALALDPADERLRLALCDAILPFVPDSAEEAEQAADRFASVIDGLADRYGSASADVVRQAANHANLIDTFYLPYRDRDITGTLTASGALFSRLANSRHGAPTPDAGPRPAGADGKIRIGIVSGLFQRTHPVWKAILAGWTAQLDRGRFEIVACRTKAAAPANDVTGNCGRVLGPFPRVEDWLEALAAERPDILIYPDGPMDGPSLALSALRLAPLQCATWGHPATTGLPSIDLFLSADSLEPPDAAAHYSEELVRLPRLGVHYEPVAHGVPAKDRAWFPAPPGATLLGCPHSLYKFLPEHDGLYPRLVEAAGTCRLVFFEHDNPILTGRFRRRLSAAFAARGMRAEDWCLFLPRVSPDEFYSILGGLDLYLDTPGFSGFNTALEALSAGVPVVTWQGRFLRSRLAAGILGQLGADDLVAADADSYVAIVGRLARDPAERHATGERLRAALPAVWRDRDTVTALADVLQERFERLR